MVRTKMEDHLKTKIKIKITDLHRMRDRMMIISTKLPSLLHRVTITNSKTITEITIKNNMNKIITKIEKIMGNGKTIKDKIQIKINILNKMKDKHIIAIQTTLHRHDLIRIRINRIIRKTINNNMTHRKQT